MCHSSISASARPSPRSGSLNVPMSDRLLVGQYGTHRIHDALHARNIIVFEPEQRHDGVVAGDAMNLRLQVEQAMLRDDRRYLGPDTDVACRFVPDHQAAG